MLRKSFLASLTFFFIPSLSLAVDRIGISQIIGHPALDKNLKGILETLAKNGVKKEDIEVQNAQGNPILASEIARRFAKDKKLAIALGTPCAQAFLPFKQDKTLSVVFTSITNPVEAGLLRDLRKPDTNLTGLSNNVTAKRQLEFMQKVLAKPQLKVGILYNPGDRNSLSAVEESENAKISGMTLVKVPATKLADMLSATQKLVNEVDVVFVNNDNLALSAISSIVSIAEKSGKPVFSSDVDNIPLGVLAAAGADQYELGRQTAEMALSVLKGKDIKTIPVAFPEKVVQSVNGSQAKKLNIVLNEDVLKTSVLVE